MKPEIQKGENRIVDLWVVEIHRRVLDGSAVSFVGLSSVVRGYERARRFFAVCNTPRVRADLFERLFRESRQ